MALGILDMLGLAATLVFAIPVAMLGVEKMTGGEPLYGGFLLVVAVLMVVLPQKLTTLEDLPGKAVEAVVGGAVVDPDEEATAGGESDADDERA